MKKIMLCLLVLLTGMCYAVEFPEGKKNYCPGDYLPDALYVTPKSGGLLKCIQSIIPYEDGVIVELGEYNTTSVYKVFMKAGDKFYTGSYWGAKWAEENGKVSKDKPYVANIIKVQPNMITIEFVIEN